jgi:hypothetical protein
MKKCVPQRRLCPKPLKRKMVGEVGLEPTKA